MQPTQHTRIIARREVARDVVELTLAPPERRLDYRPGQWISLHLPVGERPPLVRAYTLAAPPAPGGELVLCLDRVHDGLGSNYLWDVAPGTELTFGGPLGNFVAPEDTSRPWLWLARFTGIVPFRAMLADLLRRPAQARPPGIRLIFCGPDREALPYLDEFEAAAAGDSQFALDLILDGESTVPKLEVAIRAAILDEPRPIPMICGTRDFVRPLRDFLAAEGYGRRDVLWENFS